MAVDHSFMASGEFVLAWAVFDITLTGFIKGLVILAAFFGGLVVYFGAVLSVLSNLRRGDDHAPWSIAAVIVGTIVFPGGWLWVNRPVEPALVAALEEVVDESVFDESMFDDRGVYGLDFDRVDSCPFAKVEVDQLDWSTAPLATSLAAEDLPIGELLEREAGRLAETGWRVHRLVPGTGFAWELNSQGPRLLAANDEYLLSVESSIGRYQYSLSRRSCEGDVLASMVERDRWREVDAFLITGDTLEDAFAEAQSLVVYLPGERAAVVLSEYALGYGTNQLCAGSRVETGALSVEERAIAIGDIWYQLESDGWKVDTFESGARRQLVAEKNGRVVVGFFSTTMSSLDMVIVRGYPKECTDTAFVSAGFDRT